MRARLRGSLLRVVCGLPRRSWLHAGAAAVVIAAAGPAGRAAEPPQTDAATLAAREADVLTRYQELERSFLRLADVLAASDPRRAAALRSAFDRARDEQVGDRVAAIVAMLEQGQFLKAGTTQQDALGRLRGLLEMLESAVGDRRATDATREWKAFLGRIAKQIASQRDLEGVTEAGGDGRGLADRQRRVADETRQLGDDVQRFAEKLAADAGAAADADPAGRPAGEGRDPEDESDRRGSGAAPPEAAEDPADEGRDEAARGRRTAQRLRAAEERMRRAQDQLETAAPGGARAEQERALEELETARAELEQILRQLREEEVTRLLVQLETRLREMLKAEREVQAGAERLAAATALADRERQLEAVRLGREQEAIGGAAAKAVLLVRDDGSAVAMLHALEQVLDDSAQAATRLGRGDAGRDTIALLAEIVVGLEEMLAAVERARSDRQDSAAPGGGRATPAGAEPLVDQLAELKMLRSLQSRVNQRTLRLSRLLDADAADAAGVRAALGRLADRQRQIERAARDIVAGLPE